MNMRFVAMAAACAALLTGTVSAAPLADRHAGRGVTCDKCHTAMPPAVANVKFDNCLACHGGADALVKKNPVHQMLKSGGPVNCGMCHKGHKE